MQVLAAATLLNALATESRYLLPGVSGAVVLSTTLLLYLVRIAKIRRLLPGRGAARPNLIPAGAWLASAPLRPELAFPIVDRNPIPCIALTR